MKLLLLRASARVLWQHPWQLALALMGIATGVGVVAAVQLTQRSAQVAMADAQRSLVGPATHRIEARQGWLDEALYVRIARALPALSLAPVVHGAVQVGPAAGEFLSLVGIDPLALSAAADGAEEGTVGGQWTALVGRSDTVVMARRTAHRLGLRRGERLHIRSAAGRRSLEIIDLLDSAALTDTLLVDLASAQEILHRPGVLSAIEVAVPTGAAGAKLAAQVAALLPANAQLDSIAGRITTNQELTRAFNTNLTALSLLALMVGMFLIYNTEIFLLLQRQALFAQLRALGVSGRELTVLLLGEAALLGLVGSVLGLVLGLGLAHALLRLVAQTVNDLYAPTAISAVALPPALLCGVLVLGILTTVLAAALPVLEALRSTVRRGLVVRPDEPHEAAQRHSFRRLAYAALALGGGFLLWPSRSLIPGFAALWCALLAGALLLPWALSTVAQRLVRALALARHPAAGLGVRLVARHGRRQGLAAAALMAASATAIAMTIMIASFRISVSDWLSQLLRADYYVGLLEPQADALPSLSAVRQRLAQLPTVGATSAVSRTRQRAAHGEVQVLAYDLPRAAQAGFRFIAGSAQDLWSHWERDPVVMISEPYAWRHGLAPGESVQLHTLNGLVRFRVAAVFRDYASEQGSIALSRRLYTQHFGAAPLDGLGIYAAPGVSADALGESVRRATAGLPLRVQRTTEVVGQSMQIFERTFAITEVLRLIALGVAIIGIIAALLAQQFERLREYGVLRALGFAAGEIARVVLAQTLLLGVVAATCALPLGYGLALVLVEVINVRSFGWTMPIVVPWPALGAAWLLAVLAALSAGLYPAWRATQVAPAAALRDE
ncbi:MAG: ABC transporter permease [Gammaproteobacteria bacterium]|nr:ABC transporter permease [Gammaproteobacteria bacterium]